MFAPAFDLTGWDWSQARWQGALVRVPTLVLVLALAAAAGQPAVGAVAAGACLAAGLVGTRKLAGSNRRALLATNLLMAVSATLGTLAGVSPWLAAAITAFWALIFAVLTVHDEDAGWIAMQANIALVIALGFPGEARAAVERGVIVLASGLLQTGVILLAGGLMRDRGGGPVIPAALPAASPGLKWSDLLRSHQLLLAASRYAAQVVSTMLIAVESARLFSLQNGYWLPMTTLIVLKPDFFRTYSGAIQRMVGTFVGVLVASSIAHFVQPRLEVLLGLVAIFSFGCFALLKVNPTLFAAALTAYVIFMISTTGLPAAAVTGHRLLLTALGSGLALSSRFFGFGPLQALFRRSSARLPPPESQAP